MVPFLSTLLVMVVSAIGFSNTYAIRQVRWNPNNDLNLDKSAVIDEHDWLITETPEHSFEHSNSNKNKNHERRRKGDFNSKPRSDFDLKLPVADVIHMQKEILRKIEDLTSKVDKLENKLSIKNSHQYSNNYDLKSGEIGDSQMLKHLNSVKTEFVSRSSLDKELRSPELNFVNNEENGSNYDDTTEMPQSVKKNPISDTSELAIDSQIASTEDSSAISEILSLVRWLVRKKLSTDQVQNSLFGGLVHTLQIRQNSFQNSILEALTSKTQHMINHTDTLKETMSNLIESNSENTKLIVNKLSELIPSLQNPRSFEESDNDFSAIKATSINKKEINSSLDSASNLQSADRYDVQDNFNNSLITDFKNGFYYLFSDYNSTENSSTTNKNSSEYMLSPPASVVAILPNLIESNEIDAELEKASVLFIDDNPNSPRSAIPKGGFVSNSKEISDDSTTSYPGNASVFASSMSITTKEQSDHEPLQTSEAVDNRTELATLLEKWRRELSVMLHKDTTEDNVSTRKQIKSLNYTIYVIYK